MSPKEVEAMNQRLVSPGKIVQPYPITEEVKYILETEDKRKKTVP